MITKKEKRLYLDKDFEGNKFATVVNYSLVFNTEGQLIDVINEHDCSVEKQSECWEFFNKKYN